jgi:hypothetical protein
MKGSQIPVAFQMLNAPHESYFKLMMAVNSGVDEICALQYWYNLTPDRVLLRPEA